LRGVRLILGICLVAVSLWALLKIFAPAGGEAPARKFTSSAQCQECHPGVYAEWESSSHANSWINPDVRALSNDFSNTDCIDCHAPRPIFETGIGKRVLPRSSRRSEGVDCIACHALPGGGVAGRIDDQRAACRPVQRVDLTREEFCAACHDQHQTVQQWASSRYAEQGIGCLDCHMPYRTTDPKEGRDHRCLGGHDIELVRSAVELRGVRTGDSWTIEVENVGAGHSFPTDERSRAADLFWRPLVEGDAEPGRWRQFYRFRSPYRYEVDIVDNLLLVHETRSIPLETDGAVEVALFYKLSPYYEDPEQPDPEREARLVERLELRP
jgi:hypothetical protein